jgi:hypothetical protein
MFWLYIEYMAENNDQNGSPPRKKRKQPSSASGETSSGNAASDMPATVEQILQHVSSKIYNMFSH